MDSLLIPLPFSSVAPAWIMKSTLRFSFLLSLTVAVSSAFAQQPVRPAAPTPGAIRRPATPATTTSSATKVKQPAAKPVTQPNGKGSLPVIPYDESDNALNFQDASVDLVIMEYALRTGRTILKAPNVPQINITLRTTPDNPLTDEQYLLAIRQVLNLNGIALLEEGDKFLKVISAPDLPRQGIQTFFPDEQGEVSEITDKGQYISQVIELKFVDISEVQTIINGLLRQGSQITSVERTNSIMVTDTARNVERVVELIRYIDRPVPVREEPNIRQITYAKAADIKARLEEIVTEAKADENKKSGKEEVSQDRMWGPPGVQRRPLPPGVSVRDRNTRNETQPSTPTTESLSSVIDDAQKGIIRGKVSIIADERTNLLIILTRPENMIFFDKIIKELDRPTAPEFLVEVLRLEHAVAEDMATLLNVLISNKKSSEDDVRNSTTRKSSDEGDSRPEPPAGRRNNIVSGETRTKIGQLDSESISILADERTNALIIMASASDMNSIRSIVEQMDIQLSQVVIETAIVSVSFRNSNETGMDWVQRAMLDRTGKNGPSLAFATAGGGGTGVPLPATSLTTADALNAASGGKGGISAWFTLFDLNMDIILHAIKEDSRSRLLSSPRITTMDNKEATLEATDRIYWKGDTTYYANSDYTSENIKNEDIGIKLTVTPRINKKGYITLTIEQEIQTNEGYQQINGSSYPMLNTRKMGADVAVQSGETVVLGGLAQNSINKTTTRIPILGDIPLLGRLFRSESDEKTRTEIIVFLTPRVIDTPGQMEDDARNVRTSIDTDGLWDPRYSASRLADRLSEKEAKQTLEEAKKTVAPPRYPLTGYLTGANDEATLEAPSSKPIRDARTKAQEAGNTPFIHYSDFEASKTAATETDDSPAPAEEPHAPANRRIRQAGLHVEETVTTNSPAAAPVATDPELEKKIDAILD
ncbi:MAG: type II secretion system secretin GspD [Kiritimatiellia bacterium]